MIKEVTETRVVFDDEQIEAQDVIMFQEGCLPVYIGVVTEIYFTEIKVVYLGKDGYNSWRVNPTRIKAEDVASGVVKVKRIPMEMGE